MKNEHGHLEDAVLLTLHPYSQLSLSHVSKSLPWDRVFHCEYLIFPGKFAPVSFTRFLRRVRPTCPLGLAVNGFGPKFTFGFLSESQTAGGNCSVPVASAAGCYEAALGLIVGSDTPHLLSSWSGGEMAETV